MKEKKQSFKRRTVMRWTLSYLLSTLIPLLMVLLLALVTLYFNSSAVTYSNSIAASYVQRNFRDVLTRINEIKSEIIVDSDFDILRNVNYLNEISSLNLSYHAADIRRLEQTSSSVNSLFLFSPTNNWYISDQSWGDISEMALMEVLPLEQKEINTILCGEIWDVYMYDITDSEVLILIPLSYIKSYNPNNLCLGVRVSKNELFSTVIDIYHDVIIYSERQNSLVYCLSGKYEAGKVDSRFASLELGSTATIDKSIVSVAEDLILSLKCIVVMDRNTYFKNYYLLIEVISLGLVTAAFFGTVLIIRSVRRNWTHYEAAAVESGVDLDEIPLSSNDYAPFVSSVSNLRAQREELSNVITKQKRSLIESAFSKLIDGDNTVTKETLAALGFEVLSDLFFVLIAKSEKEDILQYLESLFASSIVIPFQSEYGDAFIVNTKRDDEEFFIESYKRVKEEGVLETLSASYLHKGLDSIRDSYLEAISVHEYQKDHDIPFLSYSELLNTTKQTTYQFTLEENMMLQKAIKEGDGERAKEIINRVIERNRENGVSPKTLRFLLFSMSGTIVRTINSLDNQYREVIPDINFPPILQSQHFQKSLLGVEEIVDTICYNIKAISETCTDESSETYQIYKKVLQYIHENYSDAMMNVSSIADSFDISIAYLSRIFKKYHTINISEYITSYRLDRAKELLNEGKMVGDVVSMCGFGSLRTFLRVFKAVEGITPGQYKSSVTKEN